MILTTENILLIGSILLFISLIAGKTTFRLGIPLLLLFITIGMLAGSEGIGGIHFDNPKSAQFIGIVALNIILFSGGLDTDWNAIKPAMWQGISLSTVGVVITAATVGIFIWSVTDFSIYEGLLLGSIVSSTDSAAVFSILRSKKLALKGNLRSTLEMESGSNDPMAYVLVIVFTGLVINEFSSGIEVILIFARQFLLGSLFGIVFGKLGVLIINKIKLEFEGLYIVLVISLMFFIFSFTDFTGGNGFLAVYMSAVILGNHELIHKKTILKSFDSFAWMMQIILFLTLGLLVFPSQILPVIGIGLLISVFLIFVARPVSVYLSLLPFRIQNRSKFFLSWVGLRGAVPIVFATYPLLAGAEKANTIFDVVFFVSLTSVLIQGTTMTTVAKWLHLTLPETLKKRTHVDMEFYEGIKSLMTEIVIPQGSHVAGKQIVEIGLPKTTLISIILRDNQYLTPSGSTTLEVGDKLIVLSEDKESLGNFFKCLDLNKE